MKNTSVDNSATIYQTNQLANGLDFTAAGKENIVGWGMPDYTAGVSKDWNTDITALNDCYVYLISNSSLNSNACDLYVDGVKIFTDLHSGTGTPRTSGLIPVSKGSSYKATSSAGGTLIEYPLKGLQNV